MSDSPYQVKLVGEGVTIEKEVPAEIGRRIAVLVLTGGEAPLRRAAAGGGADRPLDDPGGGNETEDLSAREFLEKHGPKRGPDKIVALASYLKKHEGKKVVTSGDIRTAFEDAAEAVPGNLPRDLNWAVKTGWLAPSKDPKGAYYVTSSGEKAVSAGFPNDLVKRTRLPPANKKNGKKSKTEARA